MELAQGQGITIVDVAARQPYVAGLQQVWNI
jgi:hypothetical protein